MASVACGNSLCDEVIHFNILKFPLFFEILLIISKAYLFALRQMVLIFDLISIVGFYCNAYNATDVTDQCSAGFYCPANSSRHDEIVCDEGSYCVTGSNYSVPCPAGKI